MSPKKLRQQNKTVTIYNSKTSIGNKAKKEKKGNNLYEQSRNNLENWEFHFKLAEIEEIKSILKCKDLSGVPLIIGAVVLNQKDILINLIKHGYNINEPDKHNISPIFWAVKLKHLEMIHYLLTNNADLNIKPHHGDDVLLVALGSSTWDEESYVLLWHYLKNVVDIDVNATNRNGLSMLHLAVRREWTILVDILLASEVNINAVSVNGVTPLMLASYRNDFTIVSRLLVKGANVKRRNSDGFTALCYALSSAIVKNLKEPFVVVERLQHELEKQGISLQDYLKDRLKLLITPIKKPSSDQPNPEQILQYIFTFILNKHKDGYNMLWNEVKVAPILKEALEKHLSNRKTIKLPLITLNTIIKYLPCPQESGEGLLGDLVKTGCLDLCLEILRKHEDDDAIFLALSPIILSSEAIPNLLEINHEELLKFHLKFSIILSSAEMQQVQDSKTASKSNTSTSTTSQSSSLLQLQQKSDDFVFRLSGASRKHEEVDTDVDNKPSSDSRSHVKKNRRRTKALKAKIAKMKTADLTERFNLQGRKNAEKQFEEDLNSLSEEDTVCVNAIKTAIGILEDDEQPTSARKNKPSTCKSSDWKSQIQQLPFHNCPHLHGDFFKKYNSKHLDVDMAIKYLENLLGIIVSKYKVIWDLDRPFEPDVGHEFGFSLPMIETNFEILQDIEKEKLRVVHREFYNLTRNVRQSYDQDPELNSELLKELEKLLLTHSIRGETILEQVCAMEVVKVNVSMPPDFENGLAKYLERVINEEIEEDKDVEVHSVEQKNLDHNSMGDYVYLNEMSSLLNKRCECNTSTGSKNDYYHAPSSYSPPSIGDDGEEINRTCCNKGCTKDLIPEESKDSRWCSLLRSLEMMEDSQIFLNGKIRISNIEKRKSHVLSPSGNFAALEIGLGHDNLPLAVKFVPKNDSYATLLSSLVEPILKLRHRNVLHYHLCAYDVNFLIIATPLCEYNLGQYVLKMKHTQMRICKVDIIRQILGGLMFLHDHDEPVVHGNLKPSNVLIDMVGNIRIAEFGIHKALQKIKNLPESTIIWFATESYKLYRQNGPLECTCASDIQVAGMLVHFAVNNGSHPFGKDVLDILKNLEKATPHILSKDMELYDLLTWMLLGEPSERPTIHQVLSHIFFWSDKKKWRYILACSGIGSKIPLDIEKLHSSLDKTAYKENIMGNCWVLTAKKQYPQASFADSNDTPSGLLKFIKCVIESNMVLHEEGGSNSISGFVLNAFPYFPLSLYRMIENTEWSDHRVFMPFHNVIDY